MNRLASIAVWFVVIVVASFMLYRVKYEVQSLRAQIKDTARELEQEKEAMHVVAAEWAYLNRPERLQQLASKYLASAGVTVQQVAEVEAIPFPKQSTAMLDAEDGAHPISASYRKGVNAP